jgi:hypothetical protein
MANALNKSKNPVAAAHTLLNKPKPAANKYSTLEMFEIFLERKHRRAAALEKSQNQAIPDEFDAALANHERRMPKQRTDDNDFLPEVFHEGHRNPDLDE